MAKDPDFIDDDENPELTDEDVARARPFKEVFPEQYKSWKKMGRPRAESPKIFLGLRMAADVVNGVKATGRGYNGRLEKLIREALASGKLTP
jgi:uncharacterized protein (DUF4415 family)